MPRLILHATAGCLLFSAWTSSALADGGALLFSETKGGYRIAVFAAPVPFRAGFVDISTLIQDDQTGKVVTPSRVVVRMAKSGRSALEYPATSGAATNKLFQAAQFELPEPGRWNLQVVVDGSRGAAVVGGEIEAAERLPRWAEILPWVAWPALVILLFGVHQAMSRRTV
jgi:hypothetical protein